MLYERVSQLNRDIKVYILHRKMLNNHERLLILLMYAYLFVIQDIFRIIYATEDTNSCVAG